MPRYRFQWDHLDDSLLTLLCSGDDIGQLAPADALRAWYGARPRADFIADVWSRLRNGWLPMAHEQRTTIVEELRSCRLGDTTLPVGDVDSDLAYLRSCRNSITLRDVVLDVFIREGERQHVFPKRSGTATEAWNAFESALAGTLRSLPEDAFLIVAAKGDPTGDSNENSSYFVQFAAQGNDGMRAEAVSNAFLAPTMRYGPDRLAELQRLGWNPPTDAGDTPHAEQDPDGGPNHSLDVAPPIDHAALARLAVATLREVMHVSHPGHLEYDAFNDDGEPIDLPELRARRASGSATSEVSAEAIEAIVGHPTGPVELHQMVQATLHRLLPGGTPEQDADGDYPITFDSSVVFVQIPNEVPLVRLLVPLLMEVPYSAPLLQAVSDINRDYPFVSAWWDNGVVQLRADLIAAPYVESHLASLIGAVGQLADEIDDELQQRFGGRVFLGDHTVRRHDNGGYL